MSMRLLLAALAIVAASGASVDGRETSAWSRGGPQDAGSGHAREAGGVGPYRFGMTLDEVSRVSACEPYTPVASTGGLECPSYRFDGETMNVSFIFGPDGLRRVQLWYYEGESGSEARAAIGRALEYLEKTAGGSYVCSQPGVPVTADGIMSALDGATVSARRMASIEVRGAGPTVGERWFARIARHQYGYLVLLLADPAARGGSTD